MLEKPKAATMEEWKEWERSAKKDSPISYFFTETLHHVYLCWMGRVNRAYWWVRHRIDPRHRYHIVRTGLRPGYYDKDMLMLHACFDLLKRFVEIERPYEHLETSGENWAEIRGLYDWWTKERPKRVDPVQSFDGDLESEAFGAVCRESRELEDKWEAEDQANLHRLIDVRGMLWT